MQNGLLLRFGCCLLASTAFCLGSCSASNADNGSADASSGGEGSGGTFGSGGSAGAVQSGAGGGGGGVGSGGAGGPAGAGGVDTGGTGGTGTGGSGGGGSLACPPLSQRLRTSTLDTGTTVHDVDEHHPVLVAPRSSGSFVAWVEAGSPQIHLASLDASDANLNEIAVVSGEEAHALLAHEDGGVLALVADDPSIYSSKYCRGTTTPGQAMCGKLDLLRFGESGATTWRTTLTNPNNVDSDGALFIWWYGHTARLVWSGAEYGVYFRSAGSSPRPGVPGEVDIHAGDTLRFVDAGGGVISGGWGWGCSHSWSIRLAYGAQWGAACHGDAYPNAHRLALLNAGRDVEQVPQFEEGTNPEQRALGGLVATSTGFIMNYVASGASGLEMRLGRFDQNGGMQSNTLDFATNLKSDYPFSVYMAEIGGERLLVGWKTATGLELAEIDASSGSIIEGPVPVDAAIDDWVEFVGTPEGDVVWAAAAGNTAEIEVNRVQGCP